jgi:putative membrane protein
MRKRTIAAFAVALAAMAGAPLAQETPAATSPPEAGAALPEQPITEEGRKFITKAAEGNLKEVLLAGTVKAHGGSLNVRQFAERLLNDHAAANERLSLIAEGHEGVEWPKDAPQEAQELAGQLAEMAPEELDQAYMEKMVKDHEKDIREYREAREKVENAELRGYIDSTLEVLEAHLVLARAIRDGANVGELGAEVPPAGQGGG